MELNSDDTSLASPNLLHEASRTTKAQEEAADILLGAESVP